MLISIGNAKAISYLYSASEAASTSRVFAARTSGVSTPSLTIVIFARDSTE